MRLSDLIGRAIVDQRGSSLGTVIDVRLVQDGPAVGGDAMLRVDGLVMGRRATGVRLGLLRPNVRGPAILTMPARRLGAGHDFLPWTEVLSYDGDVIEVRGSDVENLPPTA